MLYIMQFIIVHLQNIPFFLNIHFIQVSFKTIVFPLDLITVIVATLRYYIDIYIIYEV